ncbi:MAG TPA: prepilin-type N-terminal cleavage/methylation domain-containing protein [Myxococcales bacterium]
MTRPQSRGYTLVELMVALAITSVVMAGISAVLIKQTQASAVQNYQRDLEESGRLALLDLASAVRTAGYGISPPAAFDFARYACTTPDTPTSCNGGGRDRTDAPDELVVAWRNPLFARQLTGITGAGSGPFLLSFSGALTAPLQPGRLLQLVCSSGGTITHLAVGTAADVGATSISARLLTTADGFFRADAPTSACFSTAMLALVERVRYYVGADTDGVPALFRDRGRGQELLYRGIEDLQISYDIGQPQPPSPFAAGGATPAAPPGCTDPVSGAATWSFGSCAGVSGSPVHNPVSPDWRGLPYDSAGRYTAQPMNIRNVNLTVVARATHPSPDGTGDAVPAIFNRPARARDRFHRAVMTTSEQPANLLSRGSFVPRLNNLGGG